MELCLGDRHDSSNPFQWNEVWLNLPGAQGYDPSLPRVILLRSDGEMATRKVVFVDDIHGGGRARELEEIKPPVRCITSRMNYYGNQEASRK